MKLRGHLFTGAAAAAIALTATPALAGEVTGMVVYESDTIALQAVTVRIVELGREAVTGRDGTYIFGDVP